MTEVKEEIKKPRRRTAPVVEDEPIEDVEVEIVEKGNRKQSPQHPIAEPKLKTKGIIAVDNGGENTKVFTPDMAQPTYFKSKKGYGQEDDFLDPVFPENIEEHKRSYIVKYKDLIYLTNRRMKQGKYRTTGNTLSKATDYFNISTLIAVAKYGYDINYLITSVPYSYRSKQEIEAIRKMLIGEHNIIVDNVEYNFEIRDVLVSAEAQAGHFHIEAEGEVTLLEIGSRTVGYATNIIELDNEGYIAYDQPIREKSGTIDRAGVEISNLKPNEFIPYCSNIFAEMSHVIGENDKIIAFGGGVLIEEIREGLKKFFRNITFAKDPLYVQVRGMLAFGQDYYNLEEDDE